MSFFQGATHFTIQGGTFSSVGRDQINITQCSHREDRVWTILDEYQAIPTGKVYLKLKIAETDVGIWNREQWRDIDARRTIHAARIRGEDKDEEFLHVQYTGRDAAKACKIDLDTFSAVKDVNYVQLFGYSNMNALPALVFYDALVPVSHIWERNKFSALLHTYFSYQAVVVQGLEDTLLFQELWLDPRTGSLRIGPIVLDSNSITKELIILSTSSANQDLPSLTLQTFSKNDVLFEYLNGACSVSDIIRATRLCFQASRDYPNDKDAKWILSSLPCTFYHRTSQEIIARDQGNTEICYYEFAESGSTIPDALQGSTFTMDDGSVRWWDFRNGSYRKWVFEKTTRSCDLVASLFRSHPSPRVRFEASSEFLPLAFYDFSFPFTSSPPDTFP